jgi:hypothetical protein
MVFVTISSKQAAQYSYLCNQLKNVVQKMHTARKSIEAIANASFDKPFAKCMYMLTSESLQCENEIRAHIDSLNCGTYENEHLEAKDNMSLNNVEDTNAICNYFEDIYLNSYKKLLKDKHLSASLKNLIQNHLQSFMWILMQVKLFNDVKTLSN